MRIVKVTHIWEIGASLRIEEVHMPFVEKVECVCICCAKPDISVEYQR